MLSPKRFNTVTAMPICRLSNSTYSHVYARACALYDGAIIGHVTPNLNALFYLGSLSTALHLCIYVDFRIPLIATYMQLLVAYLVAPSLVTWRPIEMHYAVSETFQYRYSYAHMQTFLFHL